MIAGLKCQYAELLADIGFIQADLTARKMKRLAPRTGDGVLLATGERVNHKGGVGTSARVQGCNRPSSIYQYSSMATRLYGQISRLSSVAFVSQVSREISKQNNIQI